MSRFEIVILVIVCALPVVALVLTLPKRKKGKSKSEVKKAEPPKSEQPKQEFKLDSSPPPTSAPDEVKPRSISVSQQDEPLYNQESFRDYLKERKTSHSAPTFKEQKEGDIPNITDFNSDLFTIPNRNQPKQDEKSLADKIDELSPEIKALLLSGALERKNFDDDD